MLFQCLSGVRCFCYPHILMKSQNKQAPTVTGFAASAQQGMKAGAQNIRQEITTGAHAVASVAKDVARDISKYSPVK